MDKLEERAPNAIRIGLVQLESHAALKIGDSNYLNQPYVPSDSAAPLAELGRYGLGGYVEDLKADFRDSYIEWSKLRLKAILDWFLCKDPATDSAEIWESGRRPNSNLRTEIEPKRESYRMPDVMVFPEGGIPRKSLRDLREFLEQNLSEAPVVFAGSHTFSIDDESTMDYLGLGLTFQDEPQSDDPEFDGELRAFLSRKAVDLARLEPWKDLANQMLDLSKSGERLGKELKPYVDTLRELERLRGKAEELKLDSPSVLPIFDVEPAGDETGDNKRVRIRLRLKTFVSPFEMTHRGNTKHPNSSPAAPVKVYLWRSKDSQKPAEKTVLPLVCSEAFVSDNTRLENVDLLVIVSLSPSAEYFKPLLDMSASMKIPAIYCNDGAFGGSTIRLPFDKRNHNWWFEAPNNGQLPTGDGILVLDVIPNAAPQMGTSQPERTWGFVALASIVPQNQTEPSYAVALKLYRLRRLAAAGNTDVSNKILALQDLGRPTLIQARNLSYLYEVCSRPSTGYGSRWREHGSDCIVSVGKLNQGAPRPATLRNLERGFCRQLIERLDWLLAQRYVSPESAKAVIAIRTKAIEYIKDDSARSVLDAVSNELIKMGKETHDEALKRLTHRLGSIVEWFGGTSGWIFLLDLKDDNQAEDHDDWTPAQRAIHQHTMSVGLRAEGAAEPPFRLDAAIVHNSQGGITFDVSEGITGKAIRTASAYLSNCTSEANGESLDPYNRRVLRSSRATASVPITLSLPEDYLRVKSVTQTDSSRTDLRIVGALTIEANEAGAFLPVDLGHLQVAAGRLAADLLALTVRRASSSDGIWHPGVSGWDLNQVIERYCYTLATSIPGRAGSPAIGSTCWYHDYTGSKRTWVLGTSRFDFEYESRRTLPPNSFVDFVARQKLNTEGRVFRLSKSVEDATLSGKIEWEFQRPAKAKRMEMEEMYAIPFGDPVIPSRDASTAKTAVDQESLTARARGVLCLSFFKTAHGLSPVERHIVFADGVVRRLGRYLGATFRNACEIRRLYAVAYVQSRMLSASIPGRSVYSIIRQCLERVFDLQGCVIFSITGTPAAPELRLEAGDADDPNRPIDSGEAHWDGRVGQPTPGKMPPSFQANKAEENFLRGITGYLVNNPGAVVRKLDTLDPTEEAEVIQDDGQTSSIHIIASGTNVVERAAADGPPDIRFLGYCLASEAGSAHAVFRLIRSRNRPPFLSEDAKLLQDIGRVIGNTLRHLPTSEAGNGMVTRRRLAQEHLSRHIKEGQGKRTESALVRIFSETGARWNRRLLDAILQDLLVLFSAEGAILSTLRFSTINDYGQRFLRLAGIRSIFSSELPSEDQAAPVPADLSNIGWKAIEDKRVIVFRREECSDTYRPIHRDSKYIAGGICVPVIFFAHGHSCQGVLSLDFISPPKEDLLQAALPILIAAARRLMVMCSPNDPLALEDAREPSAPPIVGFEDICATLSQFGSSELRRVFGSEEFKTVDVNPNGAVFEVGTDEAALRPLGVACRSMRSFKSQFGRELCAYGAELYDDASRERAVVVFPLYVASLRAVSCKVTLPKFSSGRSREGEQKTERAIAEVLSRVTIRWHQLANSCDGILNFLPTKVVQCGVPSLGLTLYEVIRDVDLRRDTAGKEPKRAKAQRKTRLKGKAGLK